MNPEKSHRREFLKGLGYAALSVQILPLTACSSSEDTAPDDSLAVTSSLGSKLGHWAYHSHVLYVPLHFFSNPPDQGVELTTTWTYLHAHDVALSQAQLIAVARGGTVQVNDSTGVHGFSIQLS